MLKAVGFASLIAIVLFPVCAHDGMRILNIIPFEVETVYFRVVPKGYKVSTLTTPIN